MSWSEAECDTLIAAYMKMFGDEMAGVAFVKRRVIQDLRLGALADRSRPSIEFKFRNLSHVLSERGLPYLTGYVPAANTQALLRDRFDSWLASHSHAFDPAPSHGAPVGPSPGDPQQPFAPELATPEEERVLRSIRERRGQTQFRQALLGRYQGRCQVTGCPITGLLEAAHIVPFAGPDFDHVENGLLLRADAHTLFDLGMMLVEPASLTVRIARAARVQPYLEMDGKRLWIGEGDGPSRQALAVRWERALETVAGG